LSDHSASEILNGGSAVFDVGCAATVERPVDNSLKPIAAPAAAADFKNARRSSEWDIETLLG
jgi:hypothetical protein